MKGGRGPTGIEALEKVDFHREFVIDPTVWPDRVVSFLEVRDAGSPSSRLMNHSRLRHSVPEPAVDRRVQKVANTFSNTSQVGEYHNSVTHYYNKEGLMHMSLRNIDDKWYYENTRYDTYGRGDKLDYFWRPTGYENGPPPNEWTRKEQCEREDQTCQEHTNCMRRSSNARPLNCL